jgi:hypothetical protein
MSEPTYTSESAVPDLRVQWQALETLYAEIRPLIVEFRRCLEGQVRPAGRREVGP